MAGIVIIGGGVTGLSAGIHLLADSEQAHRVTVCERHTVPGGNLTGFGGGIARKLQLLEHEGVDCSGFFVPKHSTAP